MARVLTLDQALSSGEWTSQIHLFNDAASAIRGKFTEGHNLGILRRSWDGYTKLSFRALSNFLINLDMSKVTGESRAPEHISSHDRFNILELDGARDIRDDYTGALFDFARKASTDFHLAIGILENDIADFKKQSDRGSIIRLRLQGAFHENADSIYHNDGASNVLVRYCGPKLEEVHNADVISNDQGSSKIEADARICLQNHGDIIYHRGSSLFGFRGSPVHRKGDANGSVGLIMTMQ